MHNWSLSKGFLDKSGFISGNFISLLVLTTVDKRNSFNSLLVNLAVADSLFLVSYVYDSSYLDAFQNSSPDWYKRLFPHFFHPLKHMAMTTCVYMVVAVAANRFYAICKPMAYR